MRVTKRLLATSLLAATALLGVGVATPASGSAPTGSASSTPPLSTCLKLVKSEVLTKGRMTIGTNDPALAPWFVNNNPSNGKGYEAAVAYRIAATLGFKHALVVWHNEPYELAVTAGPKPFDFDINEITYTPSLLSTVSFSTSYFAVNQSIVALKTNRIVKRHSPSTLKTFLYGEPAGSVGLAFVNSQIKPKHPPIVYKSTADAIAAVAAKHVDAIVIDTPTGQYIASQQLTNGVQVAQLHTTGQYYALLLHEGNPLTACVDTAIAVLTKNGQLRAFSKQYLAVYNSIPFIKP